MTTTHTAHTANVETTQGAICLEFRAWCPCGWTSDNLFTVEDDAQDDAAAHVNTAPTTVTVTNPWTGESYQALPTVISPSERRAAASESCGCGYDLCGQCMRDRHQGGRGPLQVMPTPGPGRAEPVPTAYDLFFREQRTALRNR